MAKIAKAKWDMGLKGGLVIGDPIPETTSMDYKELDAVFEQAIEDCNAKGIAGHEVTLFLLEKINDLTKGVSFKSNLELLNNNARNSSKLAVEFSRLYIESGKYFQHSIVICLDLKT